MRIKRGGVGGADFGERFRRGEDFDDASVFEFQPVARAQSHRLVEVEQEAQAAYAGHRHPTAMALVEFEHDAVGGFAGPVAGGENSVGAQHD